jgi:hypothetical protein
MEEGRSFRGCGTRKMEEKTEGRRNREGNEQREELKIDGRGKIVPRLRN